MGVFGTVTDVLVATEQVLAPGRAIRRLETKLQEPGSTPCTRQLLRATIMWLYSRQGRHDEARLYYDEIARHTALVGSNDNPCEDGSVLVFCAIVELHTLKDWPRALETATQAHALITQFLDSPPDLAAVPPEARSTFLLADECHKAVVRAYLQLLERDFPQLIQR